MCCLLDNGGEENVNSRHDIENLGTNNNGRCLESGHPDKADKIGAEYCRDGIFAVQLEQQRELKNINTNLLVSMAFRSVF